MSATRLRFPVKRSVRLWAASTFLACAPSLNLLQNAFLLPEIPSISSSTGKRNTLPFHTDTFDCAASLAQNAEIATDRLIPALIRLQRIVGNMLETYREDQKMGAVMRLTVHAPRLTADLDEWRSALPQDFRGAGMYSCCYSL